MLFNSLSFFIFFPIVTMFYFLLSHKYRWLFLLSASCVFYMWFIPIYILILAITIVIDYVAGILIEKASTGRKKKLCLIVSIISTCFVLFIFKYFNFFNVNFAKIAQFLHFNYSIRTLEVALPIGLSFHTFQSLSYVIEVYRGNQRAEYNFGVYALYVMFYPQLVAGPIERPQNLLHQFHEKHVFDYKRVTDGLKLMGWGFFKKIVIADRLAILVNQVYDAPTQYNGIGLITATIFFAFQLYCDFSGYSDIAIGSAKVMGFELMTNFNIPYFSKSISEFWTRWHISLSTWFRDYFFNPLCINCRNKWRWYFNLFFTFLVSGLWHGANWTYITFGAIHGLYIIFSIWTKNFRFKICNILGFNKHKTLLKYGQIFTTFLLVSYSLVFFRARSINDASYICTHFLKGWINVLLEIKTWLSGGIRQIHLFGGSIDLIPKQFIIAIISIVSLVIVQFIQNKGIRIIDRLNISPVYIRWPIWYLFVLILIFLGVKTNNTFIYFQF